SPAGVLRSPYKWQRNVTLTSLLSNVNVEYIISNIIKRRRFLMYKLEDFLNELALMLRKRFDSINQGGCGAMAIILYDKLHTIVPTTIRIQGYGAIEEARNNIGNTMEANLEDWDDNGFQLSHAFLKL